MGNKNSTVHVIAIPTEGGRPVVRRTVALQKHWNNASIAAIVSKKKGTTAKHEKQKAKHLANVRLFADVLNIIIPLQFYIVIIKTENVDFVTSVRTAMSPFVKFQNGAPFTKEIYDFFVDNQMYFPVFKDSLFPTENKYILSTDEAGGMPSTNFLNDFGQFGSIDFSVKQFLDKNVTTKNVPIGRGPIARPIPGALATIKSILDELDTYDSDTETYQDEEDDEYTDSSSDLYPDDSDDDEYYDSLDQDLEEDEDDEDDQENINRRLQALINSLTGASLSGSTDASFSKTQYDVNIRIRQTGADFEDEDEGRSSGATQLEGTKTRKQKFEERRRKLRERKERNRKERERLVSELRTLIEGFQQRGVNLTGDQQAQINVLKTQLAEAQSALMEAKARGPSASAAAWTTTPSPGTPSGPPDPAIVQTSNVDDGDYDDDSFENTNRSSDVSESGQLGSTTEIAPILPNLSELVEAKEREIQELRKKNMELQLKYADKSTGDGGQSSVQEVKVNPFKIASHLVNVALRDHPDISALINIYPGTDIQGQAILVSYDDALKERTEFLDLIGKTDFRFYLEYSDKGYNEWFATESKTDPKILEMPRFESILKFLTQAVKTQKKYEETLKDAKEAKKLIEAYNAENPNNRFPEAWIYALDAGESRARLVQQGYDPKILDDLGEKASKYYVRVHPSFNPYFMQLIKLEDREAIEQTLRTIIPIMIEKNLDPLFLLQGDRIQKLNKYRRKKPNVFQYADIASKQQDEQVKLMVINRQVENFNAEHKNKPFDSSLWEEEMNIEKHGYNFGDRVVSGEEKRFFSPLILLNETELFPYDPSYGNTIDISSKLQFDESIQVLNDIKLSSYYLIFNGFSVQKPKKGFKGETQEVVVFDNKLVLDGIDFTDLYHRITKLKAIIERVNLKYTTGPPKFKKNDVVTVLTEDTFPNLDDIFWPDNIPPDLLLQRDMLLRDLFGKEELTDDDSQFFDKLLQTLTTQFFVDEDATIVEALEMTQQKTRMVLASSNYDWVDPTVVTEYGRKLLDLCLEFYVFGQIKDEIANYLDNAFGKKRAFQKGVWVPHTFLVKKELEIDAELKFGNVEKTPDWVKLEMKNQYIRRIRIIDAESLLVNLLGNKAIVTGKDQVVPVPDLKDKLSADISKRNPVTQEKRPDLQIFNSVYPYLSFSGTPIGLELLTYKIMNHVKNEKNKKGLEEAEQDKKLAFSPIKFSINMPPSRAKEGKAVEEKTSATPLLAWPLGDIYKIYPSKIFMERREPLALFFKIYVKGEEWSLSSRKTVTGLKTFNPGDDIIQNMINDVVTAESEHLQGTPQTRVFTSDFLKTRLLRILGIMADAINDLKAKTIQIAAAQTDPLQVEGDHVAFTLMQTYDTRVTKYEQPNDFYVDAEDMKIFVVFMAYTLGENSVLYTKRQKSRAGATADPATTVDVTTTSKRMSSRTRTHRARVASSKRSTSISVNANPTSVKFVGSRIDPFPMMVSPRNYELILYSDSGVDIHEGPLDLSKGITWPETLKEQSALEKLRGYFLLGEKRAKFSNYHFQNLVSLLSTLQLMVLDLERTMDAVVSKYVQLKSAFEKYGYPIDAFFWGQLVIRTNLERETFADIASRIMMSITTGISTGNIAKFVRNELSGVQENWNSLFVDYVTYLGSWVSSPSNMYLNESKIAAYWASFYTVAEGMPEIGPVSFSLWLRTEERTGLAILEELKNKKKHLTEKEEQDKLFGTPDTETALEEAMKNYNVSIQNAVQHLRRMEVLANRFAILATDYILKTRKSADFNIFGFSNLKAFERVMDSDQSTRFEFLKFMQLVSENAGELQVVADSFRHEDEYAQVYEIWDCKYSGLQEKQRQAFIFYNITAGAYDPSIDTARKYRQITANLLFRHNITDRHVYLQVENQPLLQIE